MQISMLTAMKRLTLCLFLTVLYSLSVNAQPPAIGDFLWYDLNNDGIQDPGEPQLNGVVVHLYTEIIPGVFTQIGLTTTAADGTYCFNATNAAFPLTPGQTYYITIPNPVTEPLTGNPTEPTVLDAGSGLFQDELDNDATISTVAGPFFGNPTIEYVPTTGFAEAKHLDFGFYTLCENLDADLLPQLEACEGETITLTVIADGDNPIAGYDWSTGASTTTNTLDVQVFSSSYYSVTVTDDIGCTKESEIYVPVRRCTLDLSLTKTTRLDTSYMVGDLILFNINVCNEGETPVDRFELFDYLPSGYNIAPSPNPGDPVWSPFASNTSFETLTTEYSIANGFIPAGGFLPGKCVTVPLYATLDACAGTDNTLNCAVIIEQRDLYGFEDDIDSTPSPDQLGEDDEDCIAAPVFDLALAKKSVDNSPYRCGDQVTFDICVTNQGSVPASDVTVMDYLPAGMEFLNASNSNWTYNAGTRTALYVIPGLILPGETKTFPLEVTLNGGNCEADDWTNIAEIFAAEDTFGIDRSLFDIDSPFDNDPTNDIGGTPNTDEDDHIDDNGFDKDGDDIFDEDDHDPEMIPYFDLALKKEVLTPPPYQYGTTVTFEITVCNQGNIIANNIEVNDYIPEGFSFDPGSNSAIWGGGNPLTSVTIMQLVPGECLPLQISLEVVKTDGGLDHWTNYAEIVSATDNNGIPMVDADSDFNSDVIGGYEREVTEGHPFDNEMKGGGEKLGEDEDDHDPAGIQVNDMALRKTILTPGPYGLGDQVMYQIEVCNQGNTHVSTVGVVDYIPDGLNYLLSNFPTWFTDPTGQIAATTIKDVEPGACKTVNITLEVDKSLAGAGAWDNEAEIYYMEDENWNNLSDIDSNPDTDPDNDFGGEAWTADDDNILGCGPLAMEDEDDHDPARIELFDLALSKELITPAPYFYGKVVEFKVRVYNQGSEDATLVNIVDYIPTGYIYDPASNPDWSGAAPQVTYEFPGTIAAGTFAEVSIFLEITKDPCGEKSWTNYAEILSAANGNGEDRTNLDIDSTPGSNLGHETAIDFNDEDDNNIEGCGLINGEDEDDHDPAGLEVVDLALSKTTSSPGPFNIGDIVTFEISVTNQGNKKITKTGIVDYIPDGFSNVIANSPTWTFDPTAGVATASLKDLMPCETRVTTIDLILEKSDIGGADLWCNHAEIYYMEDEDWNDLEDFDSTPDLVIGNDLFVNDEILDCTIDEDDHDSECIEVFDLALIKEVITPGPYFYGQMVQFRIRIFNQGNEDATLVNIADYIPPGYTFSAGSNPGWTGAAPTVTFEVPITIPAGGSFDASIFLEVVQGCGEENWTNYAEIISAANSLGEDRTNNDSDSTPASNAGHETSVSYGDPWDNVYDQCGLPLEDEDDHDPAGIDIVDLALAKKTTQTGPFKPGDIITYQIEVTNQGNVTVHSAGIIDYIPDGMSNVVGNAPTWDFDPLNSVATTKILDIEPCETRVIEISLQVEKSDVGGSEYWCNNAEIYFIQDENWNDLEDIDSTPDFVNGNDTTVDNEIDNNAIDEDDFDVECIEIFDLALVKEVITPGPYFYGQMVQFRIRVYNQGNEDATLVNIGDYIPPGYGFNALSNPFWTGAAPFVTFEIPTIVPAGGFFDATIFLEVLQGCGEENWTNYAEIISAANSAGEDRTNDDWDSVPASNAQHETDVNFGDPWDGVINGCGLPLGEDEDDHDPAGIEIVDLALAKTTTQTGPFKPGDIVTYQIEVSNQGNVTAHSVGIVDYIPPGMLNVLGNAPTWTFDPLNAIATAKILNLEPCETRVVEISLQVEKSDVGGSEYWCNNAEIYFIQDENWNDLEDIDSTPDFVNGNDSTVDNEIDNNAIDEDDFDVECIEIFDLALVKEVITPGPYFYGQMVQFRIRVYNQGNEDATQVTIGDYIPPGYGFNALSNPFWTGAAPFVTFDIPTIVPAGGFFDATIFLEVLQGCGEKNWTNYAEIISAANSVGEDRTNDDWDSVPASNTTHETDVNFGDPWDGVINGCGLPLGEDEDDHDPAGIEVNDLALAKTTTATGPFNIGDVVTFEIAVTNQGNTTIHDAGIIDYIPTGFANTLGNAPTWNYDEASSVSTTRLSEIEPCETRTVEISFVIEKDAVGSPTHWCNNAEIFYMQDSNWNTVDDIDSTPDTVNGNDTTTDNEIDDNSIDQDDHDVECIEIIDLALRKTVVTPGPYQYGQLIQFNIEVFNQGNETATLVNIVDHVPPGYEFDPAFNPFWSGAAPLVDFTIPGGIIAGTSFNIPLFLRLQKSDGCNKDWINYAEVNSHANADGVDRSTWDIDSSPNSNSPYENEVIPDHPFDDVIDGCGEIVGEDEDDHDPAGIEVIDAALRKYTTQTPCFEIGDIVTYQIEVINQGGEVIPLLGIADYIPDGLEYLPTNGPLWTSGAVGGVATTKVTNLQPCETRVLEISLQVTKSTAGMTAWDNYAEIYSMLDENFVPMLDIDSNPDDDVTNDSGGVIGTSDDNNVDGCGPNAQIGVDNDEDDHDPERIEIFDLALKKELLTDGPYAYCDVLEFEITVCNQGNEAATLVNVVDHLPVGYEFDAALNPAWTGTHPLVTYQFPGSILPETCETVSIFLKIDNTSGGVKNWVNYAEIMSAANSQGVDRTNCDLDSDTNSNSAEELAVCIGDPDDDNMLGCGAFANEDQDDHDPAGIDIFDLALDKRVTTPGPYDWGDVVCYEINVYNQGSMDARNIRIIDYLPVGLAYTMDNFPLWNYNDLDREAVTMIMGPLAPGQSESVEICLEVLKLKDNEFAWDNRAEIYSAKDGDFITQPDIDSNYDDIVGNDVGGRPWTLEDNYIDDDGTDCDNTNIPLCRFNEIGIVDEDDEDVARIEIPDLALRKTLPVCPTDYNQTVTFEIEIFNQGNEDANNITITDYMPPGYIFNFISSPGWVQTSANTLEYIYAGPLEPGTSDVITLDLIIIRTNGGEKDWINYAEITHFEGRECSFPDFGAPYDDRDDWDMDSTPGSNSPYENCVELPPYDLAPPLYVIDESTCPWDDEICGCGPEYGEDEDDHDPAGKEIFDLAQRKTTNTTPPYRYCDVVPFEIEVFNQGSIIAENIDVTDYIPCGFEFDQAVNPDWSYDPITRKAVCNIAGPFHPGTSVIKVINLMVVPCIPDSKIAWTNYTEISDAEAYNDVNPDDFDSSDDNVNDETLIIDNAIQAGTNTDEDDHDCEKIDVLDLALRKTTPDCGPFAIGDVVKFDITIYNQGNVNAHNIVVGDSINSGFIYLPGLNPGWTQIGNIATNTITTPLEPMDSTKLEIYFEITSDDDPFYSDWWNRAEIVSATDPTGTITVDADSQPDANFNNDNYVAPNSENYGFFDPNDDVIDENMNLFCGNGDDEDDSDPAKVLVLGGIGDYVWKDLNGDGLQDPNEPGIEGVVVYLTDCDGNELDVMVTDADGFYFFDNLLEGFYQLHFDISNQPPGCAFTLQNVGDDDTIDSDVDLLGDIPCTQVLAGTYDSTYDAGLLVLANLGDFVWHDLDADGIQEPGEPGIPGVIVNLYDADGTLVRTTFTNADGYYLFDLLYPGDYYVEFETPDGFLNTPANQGVNDALDSDVDGSNGPGTTVITRLDSGENDLDWDAGYYMCVPIGELVWYDVNENDIWDDEENGINGLDVNLYKLVNGVWILWETQETGHKPGTPSDDGYFKFCAIPGTYYIEIPIPPTGLVPAQPHRGNNEEIDSDLDRSNGPGTTAQFTVISGDVVCNIGAGFYPQAQIGDRVWLDINANGIQENVESPMAGVEIRAINMMGDIIDRDTTDASGKYMIENLQKEDYYLRIVNPAGYGLTDANMTNDLIDSDFDNSNGYGTTPTFSMSPGDSIVNIDAGLIFGVVPLDLLSFTGENRGDYNQLDWKTANEFNASHFDIQRKLNNQDEFVTIGKVNSVGVSQEINLYNFKDTDIENDGIYYYRLKQVDSDGQFTFSNIVTIRIATSTANGFTSYPNPAVENVNLSITLMTDNDVSLSIYDAAGQIVKANIIVEKMTAGTHDRSIDISDLAGGVYAMQIKIGNETIERKLIVMKR